MSAGVWKLIFRPLDGTFDLERKPAAGGGGGGSGGGEGGGTVTAGTLVFPGGVTFQVTEGVAMLGSGEITLEPFSEILVLA